MPATASDRNELEIILHRLSCKSNPDDACQSGIKRGHGDVFKLAAEKMLAGLDTVQEARRRSWEVYYQQHQFARRSGFVSVRAALKVHEILVRNVTEHKPKPQHGLKDWELQLLDGGF
jgi:hypothetical protein